MGFRDGVELGRHIIGIDSVPGILSWAGKLLGIEYEVPEPSPADLRNDDDFDDEAIPF